MDIWRVLILQNIKKVMYYTSMWWSFFVSTVGVLLVQCVFFNKRYYLTKDNSHRLYFVTMFRLFYCLIGFKNVWRSEFYDHHSQEATYFCENNCYTCWRLNSLKRNVECWRRFENLDNCLFVNIYCWQDPKVERLGTLMKFKGWTQKLEEHSQWNILFRRKVWMFMNLQKEVLPFFVWIFIKSLLQNILTATVIECYQTSLQLLNFFVNFFILNYHH